MLNKIWPIFIIISFIYAILTGRVEQINNSIFESAQSSVELCITLFGTICLWNGIMQIANKTSLVELLNKLLNPLLKLLFPDLKGKSQVKTEISMNMIANIMGLGNAATPLGLKAMKSLQKENPKKDTLSNSMAMFIVINTASLQVIPTTVIALRTSLRITKPYRYDTSNLDSNCIGFYCRCDSSKNIIEKTLEGDKNAGDKLFLNYCNTTNYINYSLLWCG